jgi:hypothetical protein
MHRSYFLQTQILLSIAPSKYYQIGIKIECQYTLESSNLVSKYHKLITQAMYVMSNIAMIVKIFLSYRIKGIINNANLFMILLPISKLLQVIHDPKPIYRLL